MRDGRAGADSSELDLTVVQMLLWILAALSFPDVVPAFSRPFGPALFIVAWAGALGTSAFSYLTAGSVSISLLPCFQALLVLTGFTGLMEAAFAIAVFVGTLSFSNRIGRSTAEGMRRSARASVISWAAIRGARFLLTALVPTVPGTAPELFLEGVVAIMLIQTISTLLRGLASRSGILSNDIPFPRLIHGTMLSMVFFPLLLPALSEMLLQGHAAKTASPWTLPLGASALLAAQVAMTFSLERSKWSQGRAMVSGKSMAQLSRKLALAETGLQAMLAVAVETGRAIRPAATRITWGSTAVTLPAGGMQVQGKPVRRTGRSGMSIEIWPDASTLLDPHRLDSFIAQAETALQNLELRTSVGREAWSCMEAMVYSLGRSDHRLAGHSKHVARLACEAGRMLNLQSGLLDSLRMSALLHHVAPVVLEEKPGEDLTESDRAMSRFKLPDDALRGITSILEHFDGTGQPGHLSGEAIPIQARILAVADEYVTEFERAGSDAAVRALKVRAGTLYDPAIVQCVCTIVSSGFEL
jgi:hypothetical protein